MRRKPSDGWRPNGRCQPLLQRSRTTTARTSGCAPPDPWSESQVSGRRAAGLSGFAKHQGRQTTRRVEATSSRPRLTRDVGRIRESNHNSASLVGSRGTWSRASEPARHVTGHPRRTHPIRFMAGADRHLSPSARTSQACCHATPHANSASHSLRAGMWNHDDSILDWERTQPRRPRAAMSRVRRAARVNATRGPSGRSVCCHHVGPIAPYTGLRQRGDARNPPTAWRPMEARLPTGGRRRPGPPVRGRCR